jgi:hypothetical protein
MGTALSMMQPAAAQQSVMPQVPINPWQSQMPAYNPGVFAS